MRLSTFEEIEEYGRLEEHLYALDRRRHKQRRPRKNPKPAPSDDRAAYTDSVADATSFVPTYVRGMDVKSHERLWVIESVMPFYQDGQITDVTRVVKAGKEANVYCCVAAPETGLELIAAKLYRPRILRTLKNDAIYKAGRQLRDSEGKQLKGRRENLALLKKTGFGKALDTSWWIGNEYRAQTLLFEAGADVPRPVGHTGNVILMAYVGDDRMPAPTLNDVALERDEAHPLFERVVANVRLMLDHHLIHGDLSAYNILYWDGRLSIIDFPQMVDARKNPHARQLLERDLRRVAEYFRRYGVSADPDRLARDLWQDYMGGNF